MPRASGLLCMCLSTQQQMMLLWHLRPRCRNKAASWHLALHLSGGEGGGSKLDRLSRFSGTYSWTSRTLLTLFISSYIAGWSGAYFQSPSTMNLYCTALVVGMRTHCWHVAEGISGDAMGCMKHGPYLIYT